MSTALVQVGLAIAGFYLALISLSDPLARDPAFICAVGSLIVFVVRERTPR